MCTSFLFFWAFPGTLASRHLGSRESDVPGQLLKALDTIIERNTVSCDVPAKCSQLSHLYGSFQVTEVAKADKSGLGMSRVDWFVSKADSHQTHNRLPCQQLRPGLLSPPQKMHQVNICKSQAWCLGALVQELESAPIDNGFGKYLREAEGSEKRRPDTLRSLPVSSMNFHR